MSIFGYLRGLEGLQCSDWVYLAFQLSSHPYICTCNIRKQSDKSLSSNPKYEIYSFFQIFRAARFSYMGPNVKCEKKIFLGYSGGGGGGGDWMALPSFPLTYIILHIIWKQSANDFLKLSRSRCSVCVRRSGGVTMTKT